MRNEESTPTAEQIRKDERAKQVQSLDTDMMSQDIQRQDKDADIYIYNYGQWPRILTGLLIADINVILN